MTGCMVLQRVEFWVAIYPLCVLSVSSQDGYDEQGHKRIGIGLLTFTCTG